MKLLQKNIWDDFDSLDYVCVTTNSTSKADGTLVMGAGNALQASNRNPRLKVDFGKQLKERGLFNKVYGLLYAQEKYIAFQTKIHWKEESPLYVVEKSTDMLRRLALKYPNKKFGLPFPAINNGKRTPSEIFPMLLTLPDNVFVYHLQPLY